MAISKWRNLKLCTRTRTRTAPAALAYCKLKRCGIRISTRGMQDIVGRAWASTCRCWMCMEQLHVLNVHGAVLVACGEMCMEQCGMCWNVHGAVACACHQNVSLAESIAQLKDPEVMILSCPLQRWSSLAGRYRSGLCLCCCHRGWLPRSLLMPDLSWLVTVSLVLPCAGQSTSHPLAIAEAV